MINEFSIRTPDWIHFGLGSIRKLSSEIRRMKGNKALVITDQGVRNANILDRIKDNLEKGEIDFGVFDKVEAEPSLENLSEAINFAKSGFDVFIGLGGGSCMDTAKMVAAKMNNEEDLHHFYGVENVPNKGMPTIMIPTTSGTGSEVSRMAVFTDKKANLKKVVSSNNIIADVAIIDPELTLSMPAYVTASSGIDAFIHAMEGYIAVRSNPFTDIIALNAMQIIASNLGPAFAGRTTESRVNMSYGALLGGIVLNNAGAGALHALAYPLGSDYKLAHGPSMTPILRETLLAISVSIHEKLGKIAEVLRLSSKSLSPKQAADKAILGVVELARMVDLPVNLSEINADRNKISQWSDMAYQEQRLLGNTPMLLSQSQIENIYSKSFAG